VDDAVERPTLYSSARSAKDTFASGVAAVDGALGGLGQFGLRTACRAVCSCVGDGNHARTGTVNLVACLVTGRIARLLAVR
jgi:hypothetical protein